jgi:hypothetical protein
MNRRPAAGSAVRPAPPPRDRALGSPRSHRGVPVPAGIRSASAPAPCPHLATRSPVARPGRFWRFPAGARGPDLARDRAPAGERGRDELDSAAKCADSLGPVPSLGDPAPITAAISLRRSAPAGSLTARRSVRRSNRIQIQFDDPRTRERVIRMRIRREPLAPNPPALDSKSTLQLRSSHDELF